MDRRGRILVLDDLKNWRDQQLETLLEGGFYGESASTVDEALQRLTENYYHVLIVDIRMVDSDEGNKEGIDLLGELDKRGLSGTTTVIVHSAYGTPERMRKAFRYHKVADFLSKDDFHQD